MESIKVNVKDVLQAVTAEQIEALNPEASEAIDKLHKGTGAGSDFLGWVSLPSETTDALIADINAVAADLAARCE